MGELGNIFVRDISFPKSYIVILLVLPRILKYCLRIPYKENDIFGWSYLEALVSATMLLWVGEQGNIFAYFRDFFNLSRAEDLNIYLSRDILSEGENDFVLLKP